MRPPGWETDPKQEAPFKGNPPGTRYDDPPPLSEQIQHLSDRLEGFEADYEVHHHEVSEISRLPELFRDLDALQSRIARIERLIGERI